jgi:hypothetical protein
VALAEADALAAGEGDASFLARADAVIGIEIAAVRQAMVMSLATVFMVLQLWIV